MLLPPVRRSNIVVCGIVIIAASRVAAQQAAESAAPSVTQKTAKSSARQAELEAALIEMLSGATLEGSFTSTGEGGDPADLSREKYTLGDVKKIEGNFWLIPARIQYGEHDVTLPLALPIRWAGDTPVIVVDNVGLPGFGTVSARVMFFADHYAGYWKHGKHGGHLFGIIRPREKQPAASAKAENELPPSGNSPRGDQENK